MFVYTENPIGIELFSHVKTFKWRSRSVAESAYWENFWKRLHPKGIFFDRNCEYIVTGLISPILKIYGKLMKEHSKCLRLKMKHDK